MSPLVDHILVALLIVGALAFFARRFFSKKKSCGSGCCDVGKPKIGR